MRKVQVGKNKFVKYDETVSYSPSYSPALPHFLRVPTRIVGEVPFNSQRQNYEFVDRHGAEINVSYVTYCEHHNKCYF